MKFKRKFLLLLFLLCAIVTEVGARTIYFQKPNEWGEVWIWAWNNNSNIGDRPQMIKLPRLDNIYYANIDDKFSGIAFCSSKDAPAPSGMEGLTIPGSDQVFFKSTSSEAGYWEGNANQKLYFYNKGWEDSHVDAFVWANVNGTDVFGARDIAMTKVQNTDGWYSCDIPLGSTGVTFHKNGSWQDGDKVEAGNISGAFEPCYITDPTNSGWKSRYSLVGDIFSWNTDTRVHMNFSNTGYYLTYQLTNNDATGNFYFFDENTRKRCGNSTTVTAGDGSWHEIGDNENGADNKIEAYSHSRTIIVDPTTKKFKVEFEQAPVTTKKIYFYNARNLPNMKVYAWHWDGSVTDEANLKKIGNTGWMYCDINANVTELSFKSGDTDIVANQPIPKNVGDQNNIIPYYVDSPEGRGAWAYQLIGIEDSDWHKASEWKMTKDGLLSYSFPASDTNSREFKFLKTFYNVSESKWDQSWVSNGTTVAVGDHVTINAPSDYNTKINGNPNNGVRVLLYDAVAGKFWLEYENPNSNIPESSDPTFSDSEQNKGPEDVVSIFGEYYGNISDVKARQWDGDVLVDQSTFTEDTSNHYYKIAKSGWISIYSADDWKAFGLKYKEIKNGESFSHDRLSFDVYSDINTCVRAIPNHDSKIDENNKEQLVFVPAHQWTTVTVDLTQSPFNVPGFDLSKINSVNIGTENGATIAIDNVYFWVSNYDNHQSPATTDCDNRGLNWTFKSKNTEADGIEKGAKDYVFRVLYPQTDGSTGNTTMKVGTEAHDWNLNTSSDTQRGEENGYYVLQLQKRIAIGDVELIWNNGYPSDYEVYATDEWPIKNEQLDTDVMGRAHRLYSRSGMHIDYAPYYDSQSKLNASNDAWGRFVVVKMTNRGNKFFGYALKEAHVGYQNAEYNTVTNLGMKYMRTKTGYGNVLRNQKVYTTNSRGTLLNEKNSGVTITCTSEYVSIEPNNDGTFNIWASAPGDYTLNITDGARSGTVELTVTEAWEHSITQGKHVIASHVEEANQNTLEHSADKENWISQYVSSKYTPDKAVDGHEAVDDESRWCSGSWFTQKHWPENNTTGTDKDGYPNNTVDGPEWLLIDLGEEYAINDFEIIWEQAYAADYEVYGFQTLDQLGVSSTSLEGIQNTATDKATIRTKILDDQYDSRIILSKKFKNAKGEGEGEDAPNMFPYNDINTALDVAGVPKTMTITKNNSARYLLIGMNKLATDFGYSLWEIYSSGYPVASLKVDMKLDAPDLKMPVGEFRSQTVTAKPNDASDTSHDIEKVKPVTFKVFTCDPSTHAKGAELTGDDLNKLTITDRADGTYIVTGNTKGMYWVEMESHNVWYPTSDDIIRGHFLVTVGNVRVPMAIDPSKSTPEHQVYDNGYYDESVLVKNSSRTVTTIDLRAVDFENLSDVDGANKPVTLPSPWTLNANSDNITHEKMNPNVIYYVPDLTTTPSGDQKVNDGPHVAKHDNNGVWRIPTLYIWDGWDFNPLVREGGTIVDNTLRFYTSLTAGKYSFLVLPFAINKSWLDQKGLKLYVPQSYDAENNEMTITEATDFGSGMVGHPYIITTDDKTLAATTGKDYTVYIKGNDGENSLNCFPQTTTVSGLSNEYNIDFIGTYTYSTVPRSTDSYQSFWFDGIHNEFKSVGKESTENVKITPFYAHMRLTQKSTTGQSLAKSLNGMKFVVADEEDLIVTSIKNLEETKVADGIYTVGGLKVADNAEALKNLPKGMYIVNGKKIIK